MDQPKQTPWFEMDTPPIRPGVFKFCNKATGHEFYMYFFAGFYYQTAYSPDDALENYKKLEISIINYRTDNSHLQWCGLLADIEIK